jgi:hypothetical protein
MGTDEYQMYLYAVRGGQARIELVRLPDGPWVREFPLGGLAGAAVTAASAASTVTSWPWERPTGG